MDLESLLNFKEIIFLFEFLAALAGILSFNKCRDSFSRYFVFFLIFIFLIELVGHYTSLYKYNVLTFLENTKFKKNHWLYNLFLIINFLFYFMFFSSYIKSIRIKYILKYVSILYLTTTIINLIFSDAFFKGVSAYTFISGSLILLGAVFYYFYEVIQDDEILNFKKSFTFYVAVGALVFHLCVAPLFIFSRYFIKDDNPLFVKIYIITLTIANIFMYTCYIYGFITCFRKNKSY